MFPVIILLFGQMAMGQDYEFRKAGLLLERCSFEPVAQIMILKDEAEFSVNSDLSLHLERHVTFKFFKEKIIISINNYIFD